MLSLTKDLCTELKELREHVRVGSWPGSQDMMTEQGCQGSPCTALPSLGCPHSSPVTLQSAGHQVLSFSHVAQLHPPLLTARGAVYTPTLHPALQTHPPHRPTEPSSRTQVAAPFPAQSRSLLLGAGEAQS